VFAEPLLILLGQELHISKLAGLYCVYNLPSIVLFPLMDTFRRFLAVQGKKRRLPCFFNAV
jgi:Na+-driven multidrug efflux pump